MISGYYNSVKGFKAVEPRVYLGLKELLYIRSKVFIVYFTCFMNAGEKIFICSHGLLICLTVYKRS